jgi:hypothetical protein
VGGYKGPAGAGGTDLVVECTDVQGRVPRGILGSRLSPVEKQMFQVLGVAPLAGLGGQSCWVRPSLNPSRPLFRGAKNPHIYLFSFLSPFLLSASQVQMFSHFQA